MDVEFEEFGCVFLRILIVFQLAKTWIYDLRARNISYEPLSWSQGSYATRMPPLFHPLPGLRLPPPLSDQMERFPTKITTLPNGFRIASEDSLVCNLSVF